MKTFKAIALAALTMIGALGLASATRAHADTTSSSTAVETTGYGSVVAAKDGGKIEAVAMGGKDGGVFAAAAAKDGGKIELVEFEKGDAAK